MFFAFLTVDVSWAVELLGDPGFELSAPNGTFPDSGSWKKAWYPLNAGQVCTSTAAHTGRSGLWEYTADSGGLSWSGIYQQVQAAAGQKATGSAWVRTPPAGLGGSWSNGSKACVRLEFLDQSGAQLTIHDSDCITAADSGWAPLTVTTPAAPAGTESVIFRCYVEKPNNGAAVKSVANFDDCSLTLSEPQGRLSVSPEVVGIRNATQAAVFKLKNEGKASLGWSISESYEWITEAVPSTGALAPGESVTVNLKVSRAGLKGICRKGSLKISSNGGAKNVLVYMDLPGYSVPAKPSVTFTTGYQLVLKKRLLNGTLASAKPYAIKGVAWSPAGIGNPGDITSRRNAFRQWYVADIQLMKEAGINTVYTFIDMWPDFRGIEVLDNLYKNGIMAIITVDEDGTDNKVILEKVVQAYKNHPAILMWALGNEWNILRPDVRKFYKKYPTREEAAAAIQQNAMRIKELDKNHPIASILGEIKIGGGENDQPLSETRNIVNNLCSAVDVWGANIYRGDNFGKEADSLFTQWASITPRPLFLSEFGTDAYKTTSNPKCCPVSGAVDEQLQADWVQSLWREIVPNLSANAPGKVCLGGTIFEWNDEWWKSTTGSPTRHDNSGFETTWNPFAHPDGFANEEYFGIVDINRHRRKVYSTIKTEFGN